MNKFLKNSGQVLATKATCLVSKTILPLHQKKLLLQIRKNHRLQNFLSVDMPTTTCVHCTGNGSTLGLLGKHQRVGVDPAPGQDNTNLPVLPKSETSAVSKSAGPLWPGSVRNKKKSEKWDVRKLESRKLSGNTCSEGGNRSEYYSVVLATLIHTFYMLNRWSVR